MLNSYVHTFLSHCSARNLEIVNCNEYIGWYKGIIASPIFVGVRPMATMLHTAACCVLLGKYMLFHCFMYVLQILLY